MRWALLVAATVVGCTTIDVIYDGDASVAPDATTDACVGFGCVDASFYDYSSPPLPPPVACPAWPPVEGTPCTVPDYQDCEYGPKDYFCNQHFQCWSGKWSKKPAIFCGLADACSTITDGGVCHAPGQVCASGDASVCVCSECGVGPPPDGINSWWRCFGLETGCAVDRPNVGTTCDLPDGSTCAYTHGGCCTGVIETCASGVWLGEQTEPCP